MVNQGSMPQQANGTMDYDRFAETLKYLLDAAWGSQWGNFTPEGPNTTDETNVQYPFIVHSVKEMVPGMIGKNTREIKPRIRYVGSNEDSNGTAPPGVKVYGQVFDAEIVFEIWEETNAQVNRLTKEFRQLLAIYTGFLKEKGLKEIQFLRMETDTSNNRIQDAYQIRTLTYFVKFEELTVVPTDIFRVIEVVEKNLEEATKNQLGE